MTRKLYIKHNIYIYIYYMRVLFKKIFQNNAVAVITNIYIRCTHDHYSLFFKCLFQLKSLTENGLQSALNVRA